MAQIYKVSTQVQLYELLIYAPNTMAVNLYHHTVQYDNTLFSFTLFSCLK